MPTVQHRGCNIHYRASGKGPLLVLQHGFFASHAEWKHFGYVDALKEDFTVATVDSLAHGDSDKPTELARYQADERAGDIVAVMDDLGHERAHVVGYSMGGWIAVGLAQHFPKRLASLSIGGWDCIDGMAPAMLAGAGKPRLSWDEYMAKARDLLAPEALAWMTDDVSTALANCFEQMHKLDGGAAAVAAMDVPVLLYNGVEDAPHDPMQTFAAKHGFKHLSLQGDHMTAMRHGASSLAKELKTLRG